MSNDTLELQESAKTQSTSVTEDSPSESCGGPAETAEQPFSYSFTDRFPHFLNHLRVSLAVTTYQAGKLAVFRPNGDGMSLLLRSFGHAMGLAVAQDRIALGDGFRIWNFFNSTSVARRLNDSDSHKSEHPYDACYLPRSTHFTGPIDVHELAFGGNDELWFANTSFSCLGTLDSRFSFVPRWRPKFVSAVARGDRCHLNGLAMQDGLPKYVTCFAETDDPEGWREHKLHGGCIVDVPSGEVVARGLCMPHSPRLHGGKLFCCDSGHGQLKSIDPATGKHETVVQLSGFTRGLKMVGRYAFVGLSKARDERTFGGLPLAEKDCNRQCGVAVVDIVTGQQVAMINFMEAVREIFDVQLLPATWPAVIGVQQDVGAQSTVVGPETPMPTTEN